MHLVYQVEVWIPDQHDWYPIGPVFELRAAAVRYMDTLAPKLPLRLVDLPMIGAMTDWESYAEPPHTQLELARRLVASGRVNEDLK